jgi:hypothetical protein
MKVDTTAITIPAMNAIDPILSIGRSKSGLIGLIGRRQMLPHINTITQLNS